MTWILFGLLVISNIYCVKKIFNLERHLDKQKELQKRQQQEINDLFQESKALLNADIVFGRSIKKLNQQFDSLDTRQETIELDSKKDSSYQNAIKLLQLGESPESVIASCNLSRAEVDLLCNLNGYKALIDVSKE